MDNPEQLIDNANYELFRECLSSAVLHSRGSTSSSSSSSSKPIKRKGRKSDSVKEPDVHEGNKPDEPPDPSELADFIEVVSICICKVQLFQITSRLQYLAAEIFPSLPRELRTLSYATIQQNPSLAESYALPLSISTVEEISFHLPLSISETLTTYSLLRADQSVSNFLSGPFAAYITTLTATPTNLDSTQKASACEICDRTWIPLTAHHLIPRSVAKKAVKRGWCEEWETQKIAWLCRACHSFVHRMAGNGELAREWRNVERILEREDVEGWRKWVGGVRWKKR